MKLLFIAQPFPYPLNTGSRNTIFHWLDAASRAHDVHLLWLGDPAEGKDRIPELPGVRIDAIRAVPAMDLSARVRRLATAISLGIPPTSLVGMTDQARSEILQHVRTGHYDVVVLTENVVAGYAPLISAHVPVVLCKHSVQAVDARDGRRRSGMWRPRWIIEEWVVRRFEERTCRAATVICTINAEDSAELVRRYRLPRAAEVTPNGVDFSQFPNREIDPGRELIGFFGNMTWGANVDAVNWFVDRILPKVWGELPLAQFRIIGPGSDQLGLSKSDPRIICLGLVPQIPDAMKDATIGVVPVISGTGVRLKLLEMLSLGVPVVTTSLGALGTGCVHKEHALIADDADSFALAVVTLLGDAALRKKLSQAGRKLVQKHSWENAYARILGTFEKAVSISRRGNVDIGAATTLETS